MVKIKKGVLIWLERSQCPGIITYVDRYSFRMIIMDDFTETRKLSLRDFFMYMNVCNTDKMREYFSKKLYQMELKYEEITGMEKSDNAVLKDFLKYKKKVEDFRREYS